MLSLRLATKDDLPLMMAWRSNPLIYAGFYQQKNPLKWDEHLKWWESRLNWRVFLCLLDDRPIGVLNIGQLDHWSPEIGYYIGEISLWDNDYGTQMVQLGIDWLKNYSKSNKHIQSVHTTIKDNNIGSIKIVKRLNFKKGMEARIGEHYWYHTLNS
jgi:RimJ/RimL family protein N-acetyltransferase